jgi:hypothetical protein
MLRHEIRCLWFDKLTNRRLVSLSNQSKAPLATTAGRFDKWLVYFDKRLVYFDKLSNRLSNHSNRLLVYFDKRLVSLSNHSNRLSNQSNHSDRRSLVSILCRSLPLFAYRDRRCPVDPL